jgi:hypothetical protein
MGAGGEPDRHGVHHERRGGVEPRDAVRHDTGRAWAREQGKPRGLDAAEAYRVMVLEGL